MARLKHTQILQQRTFRQNTALEISSNFELFTIPLDKSGTFMKFGASDYNRSKGYRVGIL